MSEHADLTPWYDSMEHYVRMVTRDYAELLMLDAQGGLGKTFNVSRVLDEELGPSGWTHQKGFTTPLELYKTLFKAQEEGHILFLDDMSGITNNTKAIDMLKAATDTNGDENWVTYQTSKDIEHPSDNINKPLPNTFCFRGRIIMSFNETPDNHHFNALKDRGTYYELNFDYEERIGLIKEIAKLPTFSNLSVGLQKETAEWIETVTDPSVEVSIRTFENICAQREYARVEADTDNPIDWKPLALDVFDLDYEKYLIVELMETSDKPVMKQIEIFKEKTGRGKTYYYELKNEIKDQRWGEN